MWSHYDMVNYNTNGSVQDCSNSIANTLELLQFCTKPSIQYCTEYNHGIGRTQIVHSTTIRHQSHLQGGAMRRLFRVIFRKIYDDDIIKWKYFPRHWPFVRGIHRSPVNSPHNGQWCGALMFSLICAWINNWVNNHEAGDLRCHRAHYDVIVMTTLYLDYTALYSPSSSSMHNTAKIISLLISIIMSFGCRKGRFKLPWANTHLLTSKLW